MQRRELASLSLSLSLCLSVSISQFLSTCFVCPSLSSALLSSCSLSLSLSLTFASLPLTTFRASRVRLRAALPRTPMSRQILSFSLSLSLSLGFGLFVLSLSLSLSISLTLHIRYPSGPLSLSLRSVSPCAVLPVLCPPPIRKSGKTSHGPHPAKPQRARDE